MRSEYLVNKIFLALIIAACSITSAAAQNNSARREPEAQPNHKKLLFFKRFINKAYFWRLKYYFVAQNTKNCDIFYGLVQDDPLIGYASVEFIFPSGCRCHGNAKVTYYRGSTAGQKGWVRATCTDGRTLKGNFTTTSLTTGHWEAVDSLDNEYQGSFGHTAEEAVTAVNTIRKKLNCPECDPKDIELKVQGQIISPQ